MEDTFSKWQVQGGIDWGGHEEGLSGGLKEFLEKLSNSEKASRLFPKLCFVWVGKSCPGLTKMSNSVLSHNKIILVQNSGM